MDKKLFPTREENKIREGKEIQIGQGSETGSHFTISLSLSLNSFSVHSRRNVHSTLPFLTSIKPLSPCHVIVFQDRRGKRFDQERERRGEPRFLLMTSQCPFPSPCSVPGQLVPQFSYITTLSTFPLSSHFNFNSPDLIHDSRNSWLEISSLSPYAISSFHPYFVCSSDRKRNPCSFLVKFMLQDTSDLKILKYYVKEREREERLFI